ncbi:MAG: AmmeMemoRadiSam system radical SAM enzyme [Syntrophomonadaceae bacterium]
MALKEALFYQVEDDQKVRCYLCPHRCRLKPEQKGICRVRVNKEGVLYSLNYGQVSSLALDPIEKKPLYHFYPGRLILSAGTFGCNLACPFCQNYSIAHLSPETKYVSPVDLLALALRCQSEGSIGVAFTYNEPTIWFEYVLDCARLLHEHGQQVALVTNGHIEAEPLDELLPYVGAMNIDVKAFNEDFYRRLCKGSLAEVKERVEQAAARTHVEITTLVIPGENDSLEEIDALASWLASINPMIPLHLSRYHPAYQFNRPPTPEKTLLDARKQAQEHLKFVYLGNIGGEDNSTYCPECGHLLVERHYYQTSIAGLENGACSQCGAAIPYLVTS